MIYEQFYGELLSIDEGRIPLWWLKLPDETISDILTDFVQNLLPHYASHTLTDERLLRNLIFRLPAKHNYLFFQRDFVTDKWSNHMYFYFWQQENPLWGHPY